MIVASIQHLADMNTKILPRDKGRPARRADNLTAICLENVGASTAHIPVDRHGLLQRHI